MWEINNKGVKMLYIYMNLGFVFSGFFFFSYQKQMISILQVLKTILWIPETYVDVQKVVMIL